MKGFTGLALVGVAQAGVELDCLCEYQVPTVCPTVSSVIKSISEVSLTYNGKASYL